MIESISDYLLIRSQIMMLSDQALIELYECYDELPFLYGLKETLDVDDFVILDDDYINKILTICNHFRLNSKDSEVRDICNAIVIGLNKDMLHFNDHQKSVVRDKYLEVQRSFHKIDKYEEHFGVDFIKELLKDEYCSITSIADGMSMGTKIYDADGNVIRTVDIIKEKDSIDLPALGIGNNNNLDTYWYLSSYNFTFTMCYLVDKLRQFDELDVNTMKFIKTLLELAERDKRVNKENYISDDDFSSSIVFRTDSQLLEPFVNGVNFFVNKKEKMEKKLIDYKVNKYCSEKTKMLIKELDNGLKLV